MRARLTWGRFAAGALVASGLLAGGVMYYLQVYGYYSRLEPQIGLTVALADGAGRLDIRDFQGIDSDTSPLRYRACFTVLGDLPALVPYADPTPLNAPVWFDCFDAGALQGDLAAGRASAFLVEGDFRYGFDFVMALYPDGRATLWPQINACGSALFDGRPLPAGCPLPPES